MKTNVVVLPDGEIITVRRQDALNLVVELWSASE